MDNSSRQDMYFASKEPEETAGILLNKAQSFFNVLQSNAYLEKLNNMWRAYYGAYGNDLGYGHRVEFTGEQGELVTLPVNHFRNIASHIFTMITANRPVMDTRAANTDYKSQAQTILANGILDYYMREKNLENVLKDACEMSIFLGSGFVKMEWNANAGEIYDVDPDTGEFNREGEIEFYNLTPLDVVVDGTKECWERNDWVLVRSFENRYNLMAKYPDMADKIRGLPSKTDSSIYRLAVWTNDETDDVPVYEFFHKQTPALPEGRYMQFVAGDIVMLDHKMPYRQIPVFRIAPANIIGTPYGYSPMFDIFPIQEAINSLYSTILTNQNAFGVQNIWVKDGSNLAVNQLEGGLNIIKSEEPPQPLNLTNTPKEVFDFLLQLVKDAETISGVNSVTRGDPQPSLKSGTSLALVQSMSLQFMSGLQQSYVKLIENTGTALIEILKDFATTPKIVALVGKNNRPLLKEFTGDQISEIKRVIVDVGNPLSHTIAGRTEIAQNMSQAGLIKTPQEYLQVVKTGNLDVMIEGDTGQLLLIKRENERLMDGQPTKATVLDYHKMHIMEHQSVIADPDLREDPNLVQNVLNHIQEHIDFLRTTDPDLLKMIGEQPLQPEMPPPGADNGQGGPPGPGQPQGAGPSSTPNVQAPQTGLTVPGDTIKGPGVNNVSLPNVPKVDNRLLANPGMQQNAMGNVK